MNYDYGIVYKMCRPRKDGFFIETSILYSICSARSPSQLPILNKTPYKCLKVISFHDLVILNSYMWWIPNRADTRKEHMTNKQKELIARNIMLVLLLMLVAMTISTFVWGYWL